MARILSVKDQAVTRGVLDKNVQHEPDLIEIVFEDAVGVVHAIFAHKKGPFADAEHAVEAWVTGTLHDHTEPPPEDADPHPPAGPVFEQTSGT